MVLSLQVCTSSGWDYRLQARNSEFTSSEDGKCKLQGTSESVSVHERNWRLQAARQSEFTKPHYPPNRLRIQSLLPKHVLASLQAARGLNCIFKELEFVCYKEFMQLEIARCKECLLQCLYARNSELINLTNSSEIWNSDFSNQAPSFEMSWNWRGWTLQVYSPC